MVLDFFSLLNFQLYTHMWQSLQQMDDVYHSMLHLKLVTHQNKKWDKV